MNPSSTPSLMSSEPAALVPSSSIKAGTGHVSSKVVWPSKLPTEPNHRQGPA